jgi:hypothetical protein
MLLDDPQFGRVPPSFWGWCDRFRLMGAVLADGSSCLIGILCVLVADDICAGMEVMPPKGFDLRAGGPRARRRSTTCCASFGPGRSRRSHIECSVPRLLSSALVCPCAAFDHTWRFLMQTMQAAETTKVIYGVNELELDLAGKTVRGIWKVLEQVFNIPRDAVVTVNGTRADDDFVVHPGDEIEFQKAAGVKGQTA